MNMKLLLLCLVYLIPLNFTVAGNVDDSMTVLHDPFQKPDLINSTESMGLQDQTNKPLWTPQLIMTLRAGKKSMANVGGEIIGLGEKLNGYKLIKVYEREVVFLNQGEIIRLTLDDE